MSRFKSVFGSLLLLSCISCPCVFAQQHSRWQTLLQVDPEYMWTSTDTVITGEISLKTGYFVADRVWVDAGLIYDGYSNAYSFSPGFRYYYLKNRGPLNLSGGSSLDFSFQRQFNFENNQEHRPVDLVITPVELQVKLLKGSYAAVGFSYRHTLNSAPSQNGSNMNWGLGYRF